MAEDLEQLVRWERAGGTWRVLARGPEFVHLSLLTCTGDEEMAQMYSTDAAVAAYVTSGVAD